MSAGLVSFMQERILIISTNYFETPPKEYGGIERIAGLSYDYYTKGGYIVDVISKEGSQYHSHKHQQLMELKLSQYKHILVYKYDEKTIEYLEETKHPSIFIILQNNYSNKLKYLENLKNCKIAVLTPQQKEQFEKNIECDFLLMPNSVDTAKFKINNTEREKDILYIGSIGQHKSPIACLEYAKQYNLNIDFYGPLWFIENESKYEREFMQELQIYKKARWLDECNDKKKIELLNDYKYFIFLAGLDKDEWSEPFGIAPLEAMACGCTVITQFDKGGHLFFTNKNNSISYLDKPHQLDPNTIRESILWLDWQKVFSKYYPQ